MITGYVPRGISRARGDATPPPPPPSETLAKFKTKLGGHSNRVGDACPPGLACLPACLAANRVYSIQSFRCRVETHLRRCGKFGVCVCLCASICRQLTNTRTKQKRMRARHSPWQGNKVEIGGKEGENRNSAWAGCIRGIPLRSSTIRGHHFGVCVTLPHWIRFECDMWDTIISIIEVAISAAPAWCGQPLPRSLTADASPPATVSQSASANQINTQDR